MVKSDLRTWELPKVLADLYPARALLDSALGDQQRSRFRGIKDTFQSGQTGHHRNIAG